MKYLTTLICIAMVLVNIPGMMMGVPVSYFAALVSFICGVGCFLIVRKW